jgi:hypothetical protein
MRASTTWPVVRIGRGSPVLARLFPWTTRNADPWEQLLRENGRPTAAGPSPVGDAWAW